MRQLLLIRHCESTGQTPDAELTETGAEQAKKLAEFLADHAVDAIVSSSFVRARQTIEPLALATNLPVRLDERLVERTLASDPVDNWREVIRDSFEDLDLRAPGGESGREVLSRAWESLNELFAMGVRLPLAVSHGGLISSVLHSLDNTFGYEQWESLSNPDVFLLQKDHSGQISFQRIWQ